MPRYYVNTEQHKQHRSLKWAELPPATTLERRHAAYLVSHGIDTKVFLKADMATVYPCEEGICFMLNGGERGQDMAYQTRLLPEQTLKDGRVLRWRNPEDCGLHHYVFAPWLTSSDFSFRSNAIYLVEGPTDALRLHLAGRYAIAVLGVGLTTDRIALVHHLISLIYRYTGTERSLQFIPDNDGPGVKLTRRMVLNFQCHVLRLNHDRKDVGCLTDEELTCLLNEEGRPRGQPELH